MLLPPVRSRLSLSFDNDQNTGRRNFPAPAVNNPNLVIDWANLAPRYNEGPAEWIDFCYELLADLQNVRNKRFAETFYEPVDIIQLDIPDYLTIITNPMDLLTIRNKLDCKQYTDPEEFAGDMNLMIDNCCIYNPITMAAYRNALDMREFFNRRWKKRPWRTEDPQETNSVKPVLTISLPPRTSRMRKAANIQNSSAQSASSSGRRLSNSTPNPVQSDLRAHLKRWDSATHVGSAAITENIEFSPPNNLNSSTSTDSIPAKDSHLPTVVSPIESHCSSTPASGPSLKSAAESEPVASEPVTLLGNSFSTPEPIFSKPALSHSPSLSEPNDRSSELPTAPTDLDPATSRSKRVLAERMRHKRKCNSLRDRMLLQQLDDEFAEREAESVRNRLKPLGDTRNGAAKKRKLAKHSPIKRTCSDSPTPSSSKSDITLVRRPESLGRAPVDPIERSCYSRVP